MANKKLQVWLPLLFSLVMVLGMVVGFKLRENTSTSGFFNSAHQSPLQEVLDLIQLKYVDKVALDSVGDKAINNVLHGLDPHSIYIPSNELSLVNDELRGNFSGIGVEFQLFHDTVNVVNVLENGPSEKAGLQIGDKIVTVNDSVSISGKNLKADEIRKYLRGSRGTLVTVGVIRNNKAMRYSIERATIPVPSVDAAYMMAPGTGFMHINKFSESTYREFMVSLEKLKAQKLEKLIVDLRGNGGGLLSQAVNIADEFLDEDKLIVFTQGTNVPKYEYRCKREGLFEKGGLVLLVDESSASASEVLAGALQDWDRATIIGRRTFGKGLVQEQFGLSDGSALRLTVARYFTPLGRNIQKPYNEGYEKYESEVNHRYQSGEIMQGDTSTKKGPSFKTPKGRLVYGGGGITPDQYVSFDTASMGKETARLYIKGTLSNFIYTYFMQNKSTLLTYKKPEDLAAQYKAGEADWQALSAFAARDSINLALITTKDKADLIKRIPALLARQMWRTEGYYKVLNKTDEAVKKAVAVLQ